jgi:hypothetical protein
MPRIPFTPENKASTSNYDYPKLKLKSGEHARILLLEDPVIEYVHTLRAPKIVNGVPQMGTEKRKDGTEYQDYVKDFVSRPLCAGNFDTLSETGLDEANCPMCRMAKEHPDWVQGPQRRYAMHVIRYKTKAGGFVTATPFAVELVVWSFTDMVFNTIVDAKTEWGDLRKHDLLLGPCTNETFQKFDINVGAKAEWLEDRARMDLVKQTFENNQIEDLSIAAGSKKEPRWVDEDLNKIRLAWQVVERSNVKPGSLGLSESTTSMSEDLASLLDAAEPGGTKEATEPVSTPTPVAAASAQSEASDPLGDLLATSAGAADTPVADEPKNGTPTSEGDSNGLGFDDLLADLK